MDYDQSGIATTYDEARALTPERRQRWQRLLSAHVDRTAIRAALREASQEFAPRLISRAPVRQRVGVGLPRCRTDPSGAVVPLQDRGDRESARWHRRTVDEVGANAVHLGLPLLHGSGSRKTESGNFSACSFSV